MPSSRGPTPAQAERMAEVVELRRRRLTQADIARRLGVTQQRVSQIYSQALTLVVAQQVDEHRAEELTLIDDAIADLLPIARDPEATSQRTRVEAWTAIRGWAERKASLLGLDAPKQFEFLTLDAIDAQLRALKAQMGELPVAVPAGHPG